MAEPVHPSPFRALAPRRTCLGSLRLRSSLLDLRRVPLHLDRVERQRLPRRRNGDARLPLLLLLGLALLGLSPLLQLLLQIVEDIKRRRRRRPGRDPNHFRRLRALAENSMRPRTGNHAQAAESERRLAAAARGPTTSREIRGRSARRVWRPRPVTRRGREVQLASPRIQFEPCIPTPIRPGPHLVSLLVLFPLRAALRGLHHLPLGLVPLRHVRRPYPARHSLLKPALSATGAGDGRRSTVCRRG